MVVPAVADGQTMPPKACPMAAHVSTQSARLVAGPSLEACACLHEGFYVGLTELLVGHVSVRISRRLTCGAGRIACPSQLRPVI